MIERPHSSNIGDTAAFRHLFTAFQPRVRHFIICFVKCETVADDLVQDVFEQLWLRRERLQTMASLDTYIFRMAKNAALNYLGHLQVERNYANTCEQQSLDDTTPESMLCVRELDLLIARAVERMPKQRRKIFEMSRMDNLKNEEIAAQLGITKKTVENHLNLALKRVREIVTCIN